MWSWGAAGRLTGGRVSRRAGRRRSAWGEVGPRRWEVLVVANTGEGQNRVFFLFYGVHCWLVPH